MQEVELTARVAAGVVVRATIAPQSISASVTSGALTGVAVTPTIITALASANTPSWYVAIAPAAITTTSSVGHPRILGQLAAPSINAIATLGATSFGFVTPSGVTATAMLGSPICGERISVTGIVGSCLLGEPSCSLVIRPAHILAWATANSPVFAADSSYGKVVVVNANTLAVTEYSISALDVVEHDGEVYFVGATGLKKLSSSGDENINPYIQTGQVNFGSNSAKYIKNLSVDASPDSSLMITGYISQPNGDVYMFPTHDSYRDGLNQQTRIFKTPRGIRGVYWGFKLENDRTNTFDINSITLDLLDTVLKR
jgi:hypothetical protein